MFENGKKKVGGTVTGRDRLALIIPIIFQFWNNKWIKPPFSSIFSVLI